MAINLLYIKICCCILNFVDARAKCLYLLLTDLSYVNKMLFEVIKNNYLFKGNWISLISR